LVLQLLKLQNVKYRRRRIILDDVQYSLSCAINLNWAKSIFNYTEDIIHYLQANEHVPLKTLRGMIIHVLQMYLRPKKQTKECL